MPPSAPRGMRFNRLCLILLCVAGVYANSLANPFVGDDDLLIVHNSFYKSWENLPRLFEPANRFNVHADVFRSGADYGTGSVSFRPLDNATYFVDYAIWGLKPFGFHLTNLLLHLANAALVYGLLLRLGLSGAVAFLAALLFGVHPVNSEAVCAIGYRADLLACFFVLLAAHAWLRYRPVLCLLAYGCAVFSKESAVVFPVAVLAYEYFFARGPGGRKPMNALYQAGLWAISAFYLYCYLVLFPNIAFASNHWMGDSLSSHILLMVQVMGEYLRAVFVPVGIYPMPGLYAPELDLPWGLMNTAFWLGLLAAASSHYRRMPLFMALLAWSFIFYVPVSNIVPLANPMAWRFLYLPSIGLMAVIAVMAEDIGSHPAVQKASAQAIVILRAALVAFCMVVTALLNTSWSSQHFMASMWADHYPNSPKGYEFLAKAYFVNHDFDKAIPYFLKNIEYGGRRQNFTVDYYLGLCYFNLGQYDRAERHYAIILTADPDFSHAWFGLGEVYTQKKQYAMALECFNKAAHLMPQEPVYRQAVIDTQKLVK